jgi:hypothetical protein
MARVWEPREIRDFATQQKVLEYMHAAERGMRRLEAAVDRTGPEALLSILKSYGPRSLERVNNLETLKKIVADIESAVEGQP